MKLLAFREKFRNRLNKEFASEEVNSFFNMLSEKYLNMSRLQIAMHPEKELSADELQNFEGALQRLEHHEPVQYIMGETEFFGLNFEVNKHVLIPRPETEELVQWILTDLEGRRENLRILDIGTGSGCIAVALAKNLPKAEIWAIDISEEALKMAFLNAQQNEVQVNFLQNDVLKMQNLPMVFDVIVSNPPYVRELEKFEMQRNVLEFEPHTALYVSDDDPLLFYEKITALASKGLSSKGVVYFEINQYLGQETSELLQQKNFRTSLKKDIFGVERMLRGSR